MLILGLIDELDHPTVEQVFQATNGAELARSTVYRTVETLEETDILCGSNLPTRGRIYHLKPDFDHAHLFCTSCGRIADRPSMIIEAGFPFPPDSGFALHRVEIVGIGCCANCRVDLEQVSGRPGWSDEAAVSRVRR